MLGQIYRITLSINTENDNASPVIVDKDCNKSICPSEFNNKSSKCMQSLNGLSGNFFAANELRKYATIPSFRKEYLASELALLV